MSTNDGRQDSSESTEPTLRRYGYWTGHFVVVASMIGAGILTTSGFLLRDTGNPTALMLLWVLGGVMALAGAVTVAELATTFPQIGGDYVFVREGFGPGAGFVAGWATFVLGFTAPTAVVARIAGSYLTSPHTAWLDEYFPAWIVTHMDQIIASALIIGALFVHSIGHSESGGFQVLATLVKLGILVLLVVAGLTVGHGDWEHFAVGKSPPAGQWPLLASGLIYVSYSYSGWNGAAYLAGEIRDPGRLLPRCLIGGTASVMVLYLLVNLTYIYALDPTEMTIKSDSEIENVAELAIARLFGDATAGVAATLLGLGLVASVSAYMMIGPRVAYAMARDGAFPVFAGRLHARRHVPVAAIAVQGIVACVLVWSGTFLELLNYVSVGLAAASGLMVASILPIRRRKDLERPYRMPLYPLPPLVYLVLIGWTISYTVMMPAQRVPALLSLGTMALGIPLASLLKSSRRGFRDKT